MKENQKVFPDKKTPMDTLTEKSKNKSSKREPKNEDWDLEDETQDKPNNKNIKTSDRASEKGKNPRR